MTTDSHHRGFEQDYNKLKEWKVWHKIIAVRL